uniref:Uncharacterized protein n=1 Tax=uncultured marine thaumarchaeote AD1000_01_F04 TaxID=1455879 RepID=A0A075FG20_9ARCH|nr:hypothetical protein [uncultured marine thaumarchaeote AD1000_01_F04]
MYDLEADWSDTANPNGVWSYNEGGNPLPHVAAWEPGFFAVAQPAWALSGTANNRIPNWFQLRAGNEGSLDWQAGDILIHTRDNANGVGNGEGNVTWTSPSDGVVDINGAVWMARDIGRSNDWTLYLNDVPLTDGNIFSGDSFSRAMPFDFDLGSGGPAALDNVPVSVGDVLKLEFVRTSGFGDIIGVHMTVTLFADSDGACFPQPAGLVSWWPGEGDADDNIANANDGAALGGVTFTAGRVGQAFSFPGTTGADVVIPDAPDLRLTTMTIDAWIKADSDVSLWRPITAKENDQSPISVPRNWWFGACKSGESICSPGQLIFLATTGNANWAFAGGAKYVD